MDPIEVRRMKFWSQKELKYAQVWIVKSPYAKLSLVSHSTEAEQTMAKVTRTYTGILSNAHVTKMDVEQAFEDIKKTKLRTPTEMIYFTFLIQGVPRTFTHQLVRYRIASYAQESMRFFGANDIYKVLVSNEMTKNEKLLDKYAQSCLMSIMAYDELLAGGATSEQARGVLPQDILTSIFFGCPLSTLMHSFEQRVCCQAQAGEWVPLLIRMRKLVKLSCGDKVADLISAPIERGEDCGYHASFDRPCTWEKGKKVDG